MARAGRPAQKAATPPIILLLCLHRTGAQYVRQVLIRPTVDPLSIGAQVYTLSGPTSGVNRAGHQDGAPQDSKFFQPGGVAALPNGNVYIADVRNHVIRMLYPSGWSETLAGKVGDHGLQDGQRSA